MLAEPTRLQQAVLNLAMNGLDATKNNVVGQRETVLRTALVDGSAVEVSVSDSGDGIPADELHSIFDPLFRANRRGSGLSLSIARTIVESYGGRIRAENRAGGGVVFRFILPLIEAPA